MANITEVLKKTTKATVALAAASGLPISIVALSHQADAPQVPNIEQPQAVDPRVDDLSKRVKKLEEEQESHALDIDFNQQQIDRNQGMIISLDNKSNKGKVDFSKEKDEFLALFDKVKQFANYGDINGFVDKMNEMIQRFNEMEARINKLEDK